MTTRAQQKVEQEEAFKHLLKTVLEEKDDSPLEKALKDLEYNTITDIATMTKDEIYDLKYAPDETKPDEVKSVAKKSLNKLYHAVLWRDHQASLRQDGLITPADWKNLDADAFDEFRTDIVPRLARGGTTSKVDTPKLDVTSKQVETFRSGHRRDATKWMKFNGERKKWFRVNRQWISTASIDGVSRVLDSTKPIPADGTEDRSLYDDQNSYVFNAMSQATNGGQALAIIRSHEKEQDARKAYKEMKDFYE